MTKVIPAQAESPASDTIQWSCGQCVRWADERPDRWPWWTQGPALAGRSPNAVGAAVNLAERQSCTVLRSEPTGSTDIFGFGTLHYMVKRRRMLSHLAYGSGAQRNHCPFW